MRVSPSEYRPGVTAGSPETAFREALKPSGSVHRMRLLKKSSGFLRERKELRFRFIDEEKAHYKIRILCRVMRVSPSGYYAWRKRGPSRREAEAKRMVHRMRLLQWSWKKCYGSPRMTRPELRAEGFVTLRRPPRRTARVSTAGASGSQAQMPGRPFRRLDYDKR